MTEKLSTAESERIKAFDEAYAEIKERIATAAANAGKSAGDITLLAATKTVPTEIINHAIESGVEVIGENRVQELLSKHQDLLPVRRHLIGHLQTNKVKDIIDKVEMIESVDSVHLAKEIEKQCQKKNIKMDVLLEVNIGNEENKSGFKKEELEEGLREIAKFSHIHIRGLMAIPPICEQNSVLRKYFAEMRNLFIDIQSKNIDNSSVEYLSMGMSEDFDIAIEEGANLVRIGSALFGKRIYK